MESILILIVGWSITSILVNGTIFDKPRVYLQVKIPSISKLLTCIQCSGFWVGVVLSIISYLGVFNNPMGAIEFSDTGAINLLTGCLAYGFLNSGISVLLDSLVVYLIKE